MPGKIETLDGQDAKVNIGGNMLDVSTALVPEAGLGDWVLVHAGFAITVVPDKEAHETWVLVRQMDAFRNEEMGDIKPDELPKSDVNGKETLNE
jgi:hydrogenase expression/formation protein HypC